MGCVSSALLQGDGAEDDRRRIISLSHPHHVVSLTSSTYGILTSPRAYCSSSSYSSTTLDSTASPPQHLKSPTAPLTPPPPPPPPPPTARPFATPAPSKSESHPPPAAEVINSWELMAGLVDPSTPAACSASPANKLDARDRRRRIRFPLRPIDTNSSSSSRPSPGPSPSVLLYTTSLRGVRATFEACSAVRAALQAHGVAFRERDVSMDRGFRDELRDLTRGLLPGAGKAIPRLFVRGRHVGGAEEVLRLDEEGLLARLLEGLPRARGGGDSCSCDGCGGMRFLPCFDCSGSRKVVVTLPPPAAQLQLGEESKPNRARGRTVVARCGECNENGLVLCPICS